MSAATPREWDAATYHRVSQPQLEWGTAVLERLPLAGGEVVVDAGCGSGRLTALLLERLPRGRVIALDRSEAMLRAARGLLDPLAGGRVSYLHADLADLPLVGGVDAVFSTATFHWVTDHARLFTGIHAALRPGGRLVAQCGGGPNIRRLHHRALALAAEPPYAPHFAGWEEPWEYADAPTTAARLRAAGFVEVRTWLAAAPVRLADRAAFSEFVTTVVLRPFLAPLPAGLREGYVAAIADQAAADDPPFELDYWRLNLDARRPGA